MQKIKKKLHNCGKSLEELSNRIFEELQQPIIQYPIIDYLRLLYIQVKKISCFQYENFKIAISENDKCALINDNSVVFILDVIKKENQLFFRAKRFLNPKSFFTVPCVSEKLGIFVILSKTASEIITIPLTAIKQKCLILKYIPLNMKYICNASKCFI